MGAREVTKCKRVGGHVQADGLHRANAAQRAHLRTIAADHEPAVRQRGRGPEKELVNPRFAVGEPVSEEGQDGREARVRLDQR